MTQDQLIKTNNMRNDLIQLLKEQNMKIWLHILKDGLDYYFKGKSRTLFSFHRKAEGLLEFDAVNISYWNDLPQKAIRVDEDSLDVQMIQNLLAFTTEAISDSQSKKACIDFVIDLESVLKN
jgi:hypothetical protein